jgi:hypothetical protein
VLDSTWFDYAIPLARTLPGQRHAGHLDRARGDDELWGEPVRSLGLGPVVQVDTSGPVDVAGLAATLAEVLSAG